MMSNDAPPTTSSDLRDQLLVDFPSRRQPTVSFSPTATVFPIRSTLTMIRHKEDLWYSQKDVDTMKLERTFDAIAITLRRKLLAPSAEDLREGGLHVSQAVGLEKLINPIQAKSK